MSEVVTLKTGDIIKKLRVDSGLTQDQLGEILSVNKSAIQKYESGEIQNLKMTTIRKLCETFSVMPYIFVYPERVTCKAIDLLKEAGAKHEKAMRGAVFYDLNAKGRSKVFEYIEDLSQIPKYRED